MQFFYRILLQQDIAVADIAVLFHTSRWNTLILQMSGIQSHFISLSFKPSPAITSQQNQISFKTRRSYITYIHLGMPCGPDFALRKRL